MTDCTIDMVKGASFLEMAIAFGLFRSGGTTVESSADEISRYFRMTVGPADIQASFTRLLERDQIAPHPRKDRHYVMTKLGQDAFQCVFYGLMRLVDGGQNRFSLAALWHLATANLDAVVDPATRDFVVNPDILFGPKRATV